MFIGLTVWPLTDFRSIRKLVLCGHSQGRRENYRLALDLIQKTPDECCFIDDRPANIEGAAKVGMRTVLVRDPSQLKKDLQGLRRVVRAMHSAIS